MKKLILIAIIGIALVGISLITIQLQLFPDLPPDTIRLGYAIGLYILAFFCSPYNVIGTVIVGACCVFLFVLFYVRGRRDHSSNNWTD